jgi:uncharacterized protein YlxP (DUF503 family)
MIVGILKIKLQFHGNKSLKDKRSVLAKIKTKLSNNFNLSISEIDENDNHNFALLGISVTGNEKSFVNSSLDNILKTIEQMFIAQIVSSEMELISV